MKSTVILGIETSCDETAAALMIDGRIISDRTTRQIIHEEYGGVVPELASRAHEKLLAPAVFGVLKDAGLSVGDVSAIAVTAGPGLAGALLVGVSFAKGLAQAINKPLIGVNHLEGHIWSAELSLTNSTSNKKNDNSTIDTPFLSLVISGGHTILTRVDDFGKYSKLGSTRDDAAGELFDKVGRMMGYRFPSGPDLDRDALDCSASPIHFTRAKIDGEPCSFSFSGLKTAALYYMRERYQLSPQGHYLIPDEDRKAISAGIMNAVSDMLIRGIEAAFDVTPVKTVVIVGGVAASRVIRNALDRFAQQYSVRIIIPPIHHCTDNGSMIAYVGSKMFERNLISNLELSINPSTSLFADRKV